MSTVDEYIIRTPEGNILRPPLTRKFFDDLHESIRAQVFENADVLYEKYNDEHCEVTLPPPDELPGCIDLLVKEDRFVIYMRFPAMFIGSSEDKIFEQVIEYIPPDARSR